MPITRVATVVLVTALVGCRSGPARPALQPLEPGVVKIAVTSTTVTNLLDPEQWMHRYAERLGQDLGAPDLEEDLVEHDHLIPGLQCYVCHRSRRYACYRCNPCSNAS